MISVNEDEELTQKSQLNDDSILENGDSMQRKNRVRFYSENSNSSSANLPQITLAPSKVLFNQIISKLLDSNDKNDMIGENENFSSDNDLNSKRNSSFKSINSSKKFTQIFKIKEIKHWIYMMLEKPTGHLAFIHRLFTFTLILLTILFSAFTTIEPIREWSENILFYIELFVTIYFFLEYILRVWSSDSLRKYKGIKGKISFMIRPIMIIELLAFLFGVILIFGSSHTRTFSDVNNQDIYSGPIALTILRFLQLVRLLYVDRRAQTWIILFKVCSKHRFELISRYAKFYYIFNHLKVSVSKVSI
jgi:hypothetical protein